MDKQNYLNLLIEWQTKECLKARNQIIFGLITFVHILALQHSDKSDKDDLFQEGILGVLEACNNYNIKNKISFLTFAKQSAINNIIGYRQKEVYHVKR